MHRVNAFSDRTRWVLGLAGWLVALTAVSAVADPPLTKQLTYQLPTDGHLPKTYLVTLAVTADDRPDWVVSTPIAAVPRTVTEQNQGRFTETWDGIDDNGMPLPPGVYRAKAIAMPARTWRHDGQPHALTLRYLATVGDSWGPEPENDRAFPWIFGHVFGYATDLAIGANGIGGVWFNYIENAWSPMKVDFNRPIGHSQVLKTWPSGGRAGGQAIATDGQRIYVSSDDGGTPFISNPDDASFGGERTSHGSVGRKLPTQPRSMVTAPRQGQSPVLYVTQHNDPDQPTAEAGLLALDGGDGRTLARVDVNGPIAVTRDRANDSDSLLVLHRTKQGRVAISTLTLNDHALPDGELTQLFILPDGTPRVTDVATDRSGTVYLPARSAGRLLRFDRSGAALAAWGEDYKPGPYDPDVFMGPTRVEVWTDGAGRDRILVLEQAGPGRISSWRTDGSRIREWFLSPSPFRGYCLDPRDATAMYAVSFSGHLIRSRVDLATGDWHVEATWPTPVGGAQHPRIIHRDGHKYIAFPGGAGGNWRIAIYRFDGDNLLPSAAVLPERFAAPEAGETLMWWHDANGDGDVQTEEFTGPANLPARNWWGEQFLEDLSIVVFADGSDFKSLKPTDFDEHGNPIYQGKQWQTLLTDPVLAAKDPTQLDPRFGGNEMPVHYGNHWIQIDGDRKHGFYVGDSFGPPNPGGIDTAGNYFSQVKLSRYVPDGEGSYELQWRVGRKAFRLMQRGEMYASHLVTDEVHGMVGVFDSNGIYHVFTDEGLYVDTLGLDAFRTGVREGGMYVHSGESWYGRHYLDRETGKVYLLMGRAQCTLYEVEGWTPGLIQDLAVTPRRFRLSVGHIGEADPIALKLRGEKQAMKRTTFRASPGATPALDGTMRRWKDAPAASFALDEEHEVHARVKFDRDRLYLRWRLKLPRPFKPVTDGDPARVFTHERAADTMSFYFQSDPAAPWPGSNDGRPGDVRLVFAARQTDDGVEPFVLGMYPTWPGDNANPVTYASPTGEVSFEHVGVVEEAKLSVTQTNGGRTVIFAASIPRAALLRDKPFADDQQTAVNFEATVGGKTKFWWANTVGLTHTNTTDEPSEARLYPGSWGVGRFSW